MLWLSGDSLKFRISPKNFKYAPVAQLDRVPDFESVGRRFESCRAYHILSRFDSQRPFLGLSGEVQAQIFLYWTTKCHEGDYYGYFKN